ncbi:DEAD/DEAH box helicase [Paracoccus benzoatiresistens]|uniref:DEAD/DEAH box helicase n=1 Tax=Paracoccus benzoatiresistens TaxID=2997341 RepID=A0ABT4JBF3_9RHOB|nr:DEAD/DEAH box helicase [Paracoccus sp. EF6]MCZ0964459.1 DEAD/DEAH box helicase [Paracoccus sp. EF6]
MNDRGRTYQQHIAVRGDLVEGVCSCPVGYNCKHVAAVLITWSERGSPGVGTGLSFEMRNWLQSLATYAPRSAPAVERPQDYPDTVKDRLLYVLMPSGSQVKIDIYKGRINAAGTGLNQSIRRHDVLREMRSIAPAKFIRPLDLELLAALAQTRLWEAPYSYGLPELLRPRGEEVTALLRRLCDSGRFLHDNAPEAHLRWSDHLPDARLGWRMTADGNQHLGFEDEDGQALELLTLGEATIWLDRQGGLMGRMARAVDNAALRIVTSGPTVSSQEAEALGAALPEAVAGMSLPPPRKTRRIKRAAQARCARLTLGAEQAKDGPHRWGNSLLLPTLSLRFAYDGIEAPEDGTDPRLVVAGEVVSLTRDHEWEASCRTRLLNAGALPVEELEFHWPGERMLGCDFTFADGEMSPHTLRMTEKRDALHFAFGLLPALRGEGWEINETAKWPYRLSPEAASLSVSTQAERGEAFQGHDWFSLGFTAEIGGRSLDVAPLLAACLEQIREDWKEVPDAETLRQQLSVRPIYLDRGKNGYAALDLSPLAPLLHLFLSHHAELGALHPTDAVVARLAEEALDGSTVRFSDHAGILPLARHLEALAKGENLQAPAGLKAHLRQYQAFGAAWMIGLLGAGFGAVLADDMGLGKTVQTLALLQARREAGTEGAALLIVPTSLLHGWQVQAAQFAPELRLLILHGPDRKALRELLDQADLVITTYPLLARDRDWLAGQQWPLVILDEAHTLKNPASQLAKALREIPAQGRIALTGTPMENSLQDLWTLFDWVVPGLLGDRKRFQALFRTPIEKHGDASAQARLNRRLRPFLLRRTKEEVAAELPPRTEILDLVILPKAQQGLYETVRSAMDQRVREAIGSRGLAAARITVLDALLKLRQVCCDPALAKTGAARSVTDSAKRERLRELLTELVAEGRRVLVFSQFVEMLRLIEADLSEVGIASLSLTGETRDRAAVLEAFARGGAPVFLLSLKAGGVGLTLTEADTVILFDPWWNPAVERQAMDRAHRIGQTKPVFVHRLVAAGTVEEKILELQARKQALADALFDESSDSSLLVLDGATLQDLFAPLNG